MANHDLSTGAPTSAATDSNQGGCTSNLKYVPLTSVLK